MGRRLVRLVRITTRKSRKDVEPQQQFNNKLTPDIAVSGFATQSGGMNTTNTRSAQDMWLAPHVIEALKPFLTGKVIRSNYTAEKPKRNGEWQVHYKQIDSLTALGLVVRFGRHHGLTDAGYRRLGI